MRSLHNRSYGRFDFQLSRLPAKSNPECLHTTWIRNSLDKQDKVHFVIKDHLEPAHVVFSANSSYSERQTPRLKIHPDNRPPCHYHRQNYWFLSSPVKVKLVKEHSKPPQVLYTYHFIQVPAPALAALECFGHPLICLKVPVKMARFLLLAFLIRGKATTTCGTAVRLFFI